MKKCILFSIILFGVLGFAKISWAVYDLPNNDADCPGNCRQIPWLAGSDIWNGGSLPVYPSVTCMGLTEGDGTTDNTSAINTCITNASSNTAVYIPAGIYYVNGEILMKNNVVLRGAGSGPPFLPNTSSGTTTLKFGAGGSIRLGADGNTSNGPKGTAVALSSGYTKGSQTVVAATGHGINTNDWVVIYEQPDTAVPVTSTGAYGDCSWCGEQNLQYRLMSQIVQVTNVNVNTLTLSRPLYYTFKSALSPGIRTYNYSYSSGSNHAVKYAGVEDIKLNGWSASRSSPHILMNFSLFCWVKNVEIYRDPDSFGAYPILMQYAYGNEIRNSYIHGQLATQSSRAYGIGFQFTTSDNKIENNIIREQRHGTAQEGGGSGNVFLYNYIDDIYYIYDLSWMDGMRLSHGAHPYMTLVEGNIANNLGIDRSWGSSSHNVFFRNWSWGDLTGNYTGYDSTHPSSNFNALRIDKSVKYNSAVGNVFGRTGLHTNWSNATLYPTDCNNGSRSSPVVYWVGCDDNTWTYNSDAWDTLIKHGNYDYKTLGVAHWDGGTDHTLKNSMYYSSKPSWFGSIAWPPIGPDVAGLTNKIPAQIRYEGGTAPPPPCVYTYSNWSNCQSNNIQSRTVVSSSPAGCTGTPILTQSCVYVPPIDTQAPTIPTNLTATAVSSSQINLSWSASSDNVGVAGYRIYRCTGSGCTPSTQITTSAANSYSDTGLTTNTTYLYTVATYDAVPNVSAQSSSASATTQSQSLGDITTGLIGYWKFDENSGTAASDSSGNTNNGTLINGPTRATGKIGGALSFDGVDDYVNMGDVLLPTTNMTLAAWFNIKYFTNYNWLIVRGNTGARVDYSIGVINNTTLTYMYDDTGGPTYKSVTVPSLNTNQWYYLVVILDSSNNATFYLNGAFLGSAVNAYHIDQGGTSKTLHLGRSHITDNGADVYVNSLIDEVRVYNRALSSSEVAQLYNYTDSSDTTPPAAPTGITVI